MKTFRKYLEEQLWSAIKLPDGTFKRGKFPHSSHEEIRDKHGLEITKDHKMGFLMVKDGKKTFMDRSEAAKHVGRQTDRADSTHLKPRDQINKDDDPFAGSYSSTDKEPVLARMRRLGFAEEIIKRFKTYKDNKDPTKEKNIEMAMNSVSEDNTTEYAAHDYYGSPKKMVLKRKSPSSSGGGGSGNGGE